jgi:putative ABC transport system permease protein
MWHELRLAARLLAKDRWFTAISALALGIGIGVNNTFFTLVNAAVLRGLPMEAPHEVMFLSMRNAQNMPRGLSYATYEDLRSRSRTFASMAAYMTAPMTLVDKDIPPDRVVGASLSASSFRVLGVTPRLGRAFSPEDDRSGAPMVVLLSEQLWQRRYGGDPSVVGRTVTLNGDPATVVGVMPEGFRFPGNVDVWRPLASTSELAPGTQDVRLLSVFARLSANSTREEAQAEFDAFGTGWAKQYPDIYKGLRPSVVPVNEQFLGRVTDPVWLAFITAGVLVLLIACANVANLLLMRATTRRREIAVRVSLGATRPQIIRQLLAESAVLAMLGAAVGVALSYLGLRLLQSIVPADVARLFAFTLEPRVLSVLLCTSIASVLLFGLAPAVHLAQRSAADVLRQEAASLAVARRRWASAFLAAEFALSLVLLTNVAFSIRLSREAQAAEFSIDPAPLHTMSITLPNQPYGTPEARNRFFDRVREQTMAFPSVSSVTITSAIPGGGGQMQDVTIAGRPTMSTSSAPMAVTISAGEHYFETIGAPLVRGRSFSPTDGTPGEQTAVVNERFADVFFPNADPLGQLIRLTPSGSQNGELLWLRVIGVAPSVRQLQGAGIEPHPVVYVPSRSNPPSTMSIIVRAAGDPARLTAPIREVVRHLDPSVPIYRALTMEDAMQQQQWNGRISRVLLNSIGALALLLAIVGLYAVTAHAMRLRQKELGIRIALGARPRHVGGLVLRRAIFQLAAGLAVGIAATIAFDRLFTTTSMRLTDPIVLMPTVAAVGVVAIAACLWPAARAARLDPVVALRHE